MIRGHRHCAGGPEGSRTLGLCDANAALSQLSYRPIAYLKLNYINISLKCQEKKEHKLNSVYELALGNLNMTITLDVSFPDVMNDVLLDKYKLNTVRIMVKIPNGDVRY